MRAKSLPWVAAGAATGLVIAFATRWYWGVAAFLLMCALIAAGYLVHARS